MKSKHARTKQIDRLLAKLTNPTVNVIFILGLALILNAAIAGVQPKLSRLAQAHIHSYLSELEQLYQSPGPVGTKIDMLQKSDLKRMAHLLYDAYEESPNAAADSLRAMVQATKSIWSTGTNPKPGFLQVQILRRVKNEISPLVHALIRSTYMMQVRVTAIAKDVALDSTEAAMGQIDATLVSAVVDRVLKGSQRFHPLDTVTFFYRRGWSKRNPPGFEIGREYFVPIEQREGGFLSLVTYLDDSEGYYPISDGKIQDYSRLFGQEATVSLDQLNEIMNLKIQELKSW